MTKSSSRHDQLEAKRIVASVTGVVDIGKRLLAGGKLPMPIIYEPATMSLSPFDWKEDDVNRWAKECGLEKYANAISARLKNGNALLRANEDSMSVDFPHLSPIVRHCVLFQTKMLRRSHGIQASGKSSTTSLCFRSVKELS